MISIIVPVYNVKNELKRCIDSLVQQSYQDIEIILVDDGSTDGSGLICDEAEKQYACVKTVHKENGGLSDARNTGLMFASGEYVMFVDSDDYLELDSCEILYKNLFDADFVVGCIREVREGKSDKYQRHSTLKSGGVYSSEEYIIKSIKASEWYAPAVLNLYRRKFLEVNDLWFTKGIYFEDMEFLPRLCLSAKKIAYVDYPFYNYVIRENSIMTNSNTAKKIQDSLFVYQRWFEIIEKLESIELKKAMSGALVKSYIWNCRTRKISGWKIPGLTFSYALRFSLNFKEKVKVLFFNYFPKIYNRI